MGICQGLTKVDKYGSLKSFLSGFWSSTQYRVRNGWKRPIGGLCDGFFPSLSSSAWCWRLAAKRRQNGLSIRMSALGSGGWSRRFVFNRVTPSGSWPASCRVTGRLCPTPTRVTRGRIFPKKWCTPGIAFKSAVRPDPPPRPRRPWRVNENYGDRRPGPPNPLYKGE